jgi:hypothetical protein
MTFHLNFRFNNIIHHFNINNSYRATIADQIRRPVAAMRSIGTVAFSQKISKMLKRRAQEMNSVVCRIKSQMPPTTDPQASLRLCAIPCEVFCHSSTSAFEQNAAQKFVGT